MATLVTRDGKTHEFAEVQITESGTHLCYADGYREDGAEATLVLPQTTVNRVEPDEGVETERFAVQAEAVRGGARGQGQNVVRARNTYAERVIEVIRVR